MLESKVEKDLVKFLIKNGINAKSIKPKTGFDGAPDVLCAYKGNVFVIEVKIDDKIHGLSSEQLKFLLDGGSHSFVYYGGIRWVSAGDFDNGALGIVVGIDGIRWSLNGFLKMIKEKYENR